MYLPTEELKQTGNIYQHFCKNISWKIKNIYWKAANRNLRGSLNTNTYRKNNSYGKRK